MTKDEELKDALTKANPHLAEAIYGPFEVKGVEPVSPMPYCDACWTECCTCKWSDSGNYTKALKMTVKEYAKKNTHVREYVRALRDEAGFDDGLILPALRLAFASGLIE